MRMRRKAGLQARRTAATRRQERVVIAEVRAACMDRDEGCRLGHAPGFGACGGRLEWAHWGPWKRFKTRKMAPARRHGTAGSLMLCTRHHQDYDAGRLGVEGAAGGG